MSSLHNWTLKIDHGILKTLKKIPRHDADRLLDVIQLLPADPFFGDIQKMKGYDGVYRRRVGSYRIFYRISIGEKIILVFHLERRTSATY